MPLSWNEIKTRAVAFNGEIFAVKTGNINQYSECFG